MWSVFSLKHFMRHRTNSDAENGSGVPDLERPQDHAGTVQNRVSDSHQPLLPGDTQSIRRLYAALRRDTSAISTDDEEESAVLSEQDSPNPNSRWTELLSNPRRRWTIPHQQSLSELFPDFVHSAKAFKLCILYFFIYLVIAVLAFSLIFERWSVIDSLYFAVVTFTTVGYGDITPQTTGGQIFTCFFALYGICILGIALGIIGERVVHAQDKAAKMLKQRSERRLMSMFSSRQESEAETIDGGAETDQLNNEDAGRENDDGETDADHLDEEEHEEQSEVGMCKDAFDLVKDQAPMLLLIILLAIFMGWCEGWQWVSSIYYCIVTTTTIGFGDVSPSSQQMRLFAVFFIPTSVAVIGHIVGQIANQYMEREGRKAEHKFLQRELTYSDLIAMDADGDGSVSEAEFISFMLVAMQKVDKESVQSVRNLFRKLDADGSGSLQKEDLELMAQRKYKHRKRLLTKFQAAAKLALRDSREGRSDRSNVTFA